MTQEPAAAGLQREFPSTCWSRFRDVAGSDDGARRTALEELARAYWMPIHAYLKAKWRKSDEDARDLAQDFFLWMLEGDFFEKADPARGRFRAFVKVSLARYLVNEEETRNRLKRGGGRKILPLGELPGGMSPVELPDARSRTPDEILDEAWKTTLLSRAERRLEEALRAEGRELAYRIFREYYLAGPDAIVYRDVAARHGIAESDVLNHLKLARTRFRAVITDLVAETVGNREELVEEIRALFGEAPA